MRGNTNVKFKLGRCIALDLGIEVKPEGIKEKIIRLVSGPATCTSGRVLVTVAGRRRRRRRRKNKRSISFMMILSVLTRYGSGLCC